MIPISGEGYEERTSKLEGTTVGVSSYPVGDEFVCRIDDITRGVLIARGSAQTRHKAEEEAVLSARFKLATRKRLGDTLIELRTRVAALDKRLSEPPPDSKG